MKVTVGDLAALAAMTAPREQKCYSSWRCARCDREPGLPVRWLWKNDKYASGLVDCDRCSCKWSEPGWQKNDDGVWEDTHYIVYGVGDGYAVWSRKWLGPTRPAWKESHGETSDDLADIDDSDDDHPTT